MTKKCDICKTKNATHFACDKCKEDNECESDFNNAVVRGLLCYVSTYLHGNTRIQIKLVVMGFYDEDAVNEAKRKLYSVVEPLEMNVEYTQRQNSLTRTAKEAEVEDILDVFYKMDELDETERPRFLVEDITKLPPMAPQSGGSVVTLCEAMATMQRQMLLLEQSVAGMKLELSEQSAKLQQMKSMNKAQVKSFTSVVKSPSAVAESNAMASSTASSFQKTRQPVIVTDNETNKEKESNDFITVSYKKKNAVERRNRGTSGTSSSAGRLKAGPEFFHVQLTNVHPSIDHQGIEDYIKEKDNTIEVREVKDTSSAGWNTKRFLVTFAAAAHDTVMQDEFWPQKVYYRKWYIRRNEREKPEEQQDENSS